MFSFVFVFSVGLFSMSFMTLKTAPTTNLYFSGAFSVTLLTMAYSNAGVKHFLDVNMVKLSKIGNKCYEKHRP